jgi:hypothetical protein
MSFTSFSGPVNTKNIQEFERNLPVACKPAFIIGAKPSFYWVKAIGA